nr:unnamed protein product [Callosobruchus analis]
MVFKANGTFPHVVGFDSKPIIILMLGVASLMEVSFSKLSSLCHIRVQYTSKKTSISSSISLVMKHFH